MWSVPALSRLMVTTCGMVTVSVSLSVASSAGVGSSPRGPSARTSALLVDLAGVDVGLGRRRVAVHWTVSPGSSVPSKAPQLSATDGSLRTTSSRVTLPVLVMAKV